MRERVDSEATLAEAGGRDPELGLRAVAALRGLLEVLEAVQVDNARARAGPGRTSPAGWASPSRPCIRSTAPAAALGEGGSIMEPSTGSVHVTRPAAEASGMAHMEARRLGHHCLGPEHLLLGLLVQGDNPAARVLAAHGLDLEAAQTEVDRLIAQGLLPGPQPSDDELLATLRVDLEAVHARVREAFGEDAY